MPRLPRAERNRQIKALWDTHTCAEVAGAIGLSVRHVSGLARRLGLPAKPMGPSQALTHGPRADYVRTWWGRKTRNEIAADLQVLPGSLTAAARRMGLPVLRPGRTAKDGPRIVRATATRLNNNGKPQAAPDMRPARWRCACDDYRVLPGKTTTCPACGAVPMWATTSDQRRMTG